MERHGDSIRMVEDVLGCKWTVQVLAAIDGGQHRPGRLRRTVAGISVKVLNERLTKLVGHGVLERHPVSAMPPHVEYHLTAKGRQLAALVRRIQEFCARWDAGGLAAPTVSPLVVELAARSGARGRPALARRAPSRGRARV